MRWSPCSYAPPTWSTSPAPSTRAKSTMHGPYPNPRSGTARRPQLRVSSTPSTARPHNYRSPATGAYGSLCPHQHPHEDCGPLRLQKGRHTASHARATPSRRRPPRVPGASPRQSRPARNGTNPGPGGEPISRPLATGDAPLPQDVPHGTCTARPRSGRSVRGVPVRGTWMADKRATHAPPIQGGDQGLPGRPEPGVPPPLPPGTHHCHRRPKRRPHRRQPHWPTHSHQHTCPGRHAPTRPH